MNKGRCEFCQNKLLSDIPRYKKFQEKLYGQTGENSNDNNNVNSNYKTNYLNQSESLNVINHYQEKWETHIVYEIPENKINIIKDFNELKNYQVFYRVLLFFQNSIKKNASLQRKFCFESISNSEESSSKILEYRKYKEFVDKCLEHIHYKNYIPRKENLKDTKNNYISFENFKHSNDYNIIKKDFLFDDLQNPNIQDYLFNQTMTSSIKISDFCDKITDGEIVNGFILSSNLMKHPLNNFLSIGAISLAYFNYKLRCLKNKVSGDLIFSSKNPLPRITYLAFEGFYSEITIDFLLSFSDNIQIIMIYDAETGGPNILNANYGYGLNNDYRFERIEEKYNERILYLPLECHQNKKSFFSVDFLDLFNNMILPAIKKFNPELIFMSHSFNFTKNNNTPFYIQEKYFAKIIYDICLICNYKLIIIPFKLQIDQLTINPFKPEESTNRITYIKNRFCDDFDRQYLMNCFMNIIQTLAGLKIPKKIINRYKFIPLLNRNYIENLRALRRYYKFHKNFFNLFIKDFAVNDQLISFIFDNYFQEDSRLQSSSTDLEESNKLKNRVEKLNCQNLENQTCADKWMNILRNTSTKHPKTSIFLLDKQYIPIEYRLFMIENGNILPMIYDDDSQYIVDYTSKFVFFFNVYTSQGYKHFSFSFLTESKDLYGEPLCPNPYFSKGTNKISYVLLKMGLCISDEPKRINPNIYLFYGIQYPSNHVNDQEKAGQEVNFIQAYNMIKKKWTNIQILSKNDFPMKRYSVMSNCLRISDDEFNYYAYVLGGEITTNNDNESAILKEQIFNTIDLYKFQIGSSYWEYQKIQIQKKELLDLMQDTSFLSGYIFRLSEKELIIIGGRQDEFNENSKTCNVFSLNIEESIKGQNAINFHSKIILPNDTPMITDHSRNYSLFPNGIAYMIIPHGETNFGLVKYIMNKNIIQYDVIIKDGIGFLDKIDKNKILKNFLFQGKIDQINEIFQSQAKIDLPLKFLIMYYFNTPSKKEALFRVLFNCFMNYRKNIPIESETIIEIIKNYGMDYDGKENHINTITQVYQEFKEIQELFIRPSNITLYILDILANEIDTNNTLFIEHKRKIDALTKLINNKESGSATYPLVLNDLDNSTPKKEFLELNENTFISQINIFSTPNKMINMGSENRIKTKDNEFNAAKQEKIDSNELPIISKAQDEQQEAKLENQIVSQTEKENKDIIQINNKIPEGVTAATSGLSNNLEPQQFHSQNLNPMKNLQLNQISDTTMKKSSFITKENSYSDFHTAYMSIKLRDNHILFVNNPFNAIVIYNNQLKKLVRIKLKLKIKDHYETLEFSDQIFDTWTIYGSAFICLLGFNFSDRYPHIYEEYKNCLLYGNLEDGLKEEFMAKNHEESIIILGKLIDLGSEELLNRILLADSSHLYLLGGLTLHRKKKNPIRFEDKFVIFTIKENKLEQSNNIGLHPNKKSLGAYVFQTKETIFSLEISPNFFILATYAKGSEEWEEEVKEIALDKKTKMDFDEFYFFNYEFKDGPGILIIACKKLKPMYFAKLIKLEDELQLQNVKILVDDKFDTYYYTGNEKFALQIGDQVWDKLLIRNTREILETIEEIKILQ